MFSTPLHKNIKIFCSKIFPDAYTYIVGLFPWDTKCSVCTFSSIEIHSFQITKLHDFILIVNYINYRERFGRSFFMH